MNANAKVCHQLLDLCMYYYNYRTRTVSLNQIRTAYNPHHTSLVLYNRQSYYHALRTQEVY